MRSPLVTLRRWLRTRTAHQPAVVQTIAPPYLFRPQLAVAENRNAPGSLLDGLLSAAVGGTLLDPLGSVAALVGLPTPAAPGVVKVTSPPARATATLPTPAVQLLPPPVVNVGTVATVPASVGGGNVQLAGEDLALLPANAAFVPASVTAPPLPAEPTGAGNIVVSGAAAPVSAPAAIAAPAFAPPSETFILRPQTLASGTTGAAVTSIANTTPALTLPPAVAATFGEGVPVTTSREYVADLPPNTAPVANNDTASVSEDGTVDIGVLGNDTDADGDPLRIDSWNYAPAHGTVIQPADGTLRYTPFPDFYGTDSFTYVASDGQDISLSATVTVTVSSVNDAPTAFNDAYSYTHGNYFFDPATIQYTASISGSVLDNDSDYDDTGLIQKTVAALDTTTFNTVGTVSMNSNGTFTWSGPKTFYGTTDFRYKMADSDGAVSDWATVRLWANPNDLVNPMDPNGWAPYTPHPVDDTFAAGDAPSSFNVMDNDTNGIVVVVIAQPVAGRLTAFGFNGAATYVSSRQAAGDTIGYRIFGPSGAMAVEAKAEVATVNLEISNGQGGKAVPEAVEDTIGAFTVANKNDTDGDGIRDNVDNNGVLASQGVGQDEMDLMRLRVYKPAGFGANANDSLTVSVVAGSARMYWNSTREGASTATVTITANQFVNPAGQPVPSLDLWVEAFDVSAQKRDISIEMKYKGEPDTVKATGIWVTTNAQQFHVAGRIPGKDADEQKYLDNFNSLAEHPAFQLGQTPQLAFPITDKNNVTVAWDIELYNAMEMEFTVFPTGIGSEPGVRFDISRSIAARTWQQPTNGTLEEIQSKAKNWPAFRENPNDDGSARDEDNLPKNDHIYSLDFPGAAFTVPAQIAATNSSGGLARFVSQMNAQEFARVRVDGQAFLHDPNPANTSVQGSRASELVDWHSWQDWVYSAATNTWPRTANAGQTIYNDIALGHLTIAKPA